MRNGGTGRKQNMNEEQEKTAFLSSNFLSFFFFVLFSEFAFVSAFLLLISSLVLICSLAVALVFVDSEQMK